MAERERRTTRRRRRSGKDPGEAGTMPEPEYASGVLPTGTKAEEPEGE